MHTNPKPSALVLRILRTKRAIRQMFWRIQLEVMTLSLLNLEPRYMRFHRFCFQYLYVSTQNPTILYRPENIH